MSTDAELLADCAQTGSQAAFGELVRRHIDLVYRPGLRHTAGDAALPEEVAQAVSLRSR